LPVPLADNKKIRLSISEKNILVDDGGCSVLLKEQPEVIVLGLSF
jgi:hypothetical protein